MPPPRKRPRLRFLGSISPEAEARLDVDRESNDNLLKTKFESIFLKYDRDFESEADEIDLWNGDIVVDNGHLSGIKAQGTAKDEDGIVIKEEQDGEEFGSRMLLAMTTAPDPDALHNLAADDLIESIETIAENIVEESEDELFNIGPSRSLWPEVPYSDPRQLASPLPQRQSYIARSTSIDSLVGGIETQQWPTDSISSHMEQAITPHDTTAVAPPHIFVPTQEETLEYYIKRQVEEALKDQKEVLEMNVEPAWRLPPLPKALPRLRTTDTKTELPALQVDLDRCSHEDKQEDAGDAGEDIWQRPKSKRARRTKAEMAVERERRRLRSESEDPLQADDGDDGLRSSPTTLPQRSKSKLARERSEQVRRHSTQSRNSAVSDALAARNSKTPARLSKGRRGRPPKLLVVDFCALVQLHEVGKIGFGAMVARRMFEADKSSDDLKSDYERHRDVGVEADWTRDELVVLKDMKRHKDMTIGAIRKKLDNKSYIDIGNKLAQAALRLVQGMSVDEVINAVKKSKRK